MNTPEVTTLTRWTALGQGGSYVYFGVWSLLRRKHYRRVHQLDGDSWVLNAHGGWLVVAGSTLLLTAARGRAGTLESAALGAGSALALATNDAVLIGRLPPIYKADLAWELGLLGAWLAAALTEGRR